MFLKFGVYVILYKLNNCWIYAENIVYLQECINKKKKLNMQDNQKLLDEIGLYKKELEKYKDMFMEGDGIIDSGEQEILDNMYKKLKERAKSERKKAHESFKIKKYVVLAMYKALPMYNHDHTGSSAC